MAFDSGDIVKTNSLYSGVPFQGTVKAGVTSDGEYEVCSDPAMTVCQFFKESELELVTEEGSTPIVTPAPSTSSALPGAAPTTTAGPAIGTSVLYMLDNGLHHGEDRPAIVVRAYQEEVEPVVPAPVPPTGVLPPAPPVGAPTPLASSQPYATAPDSMHQSLMSTPVQPLDTDEAAPLPGEAPLVAGETLVDLIVFTLGLEDFDPGQPGHLGFLPRLGIRHDPTGLMPNHWH
jgi:hypothetical protein